MNSMHSIREMSGVEDVDNAIKIFTGFFQFAAEVIFFI